MASHGNYKCNNNGPQTPATMVLNELDNKWQPWLSRHHRPLRYPISLGRAMDTQFGAQRILITLSESPASITLDWAPATMALISK